jgi:hypothetical protein
MKGRVSSRSAILWAALAVLAGCGGGDDLPPVTGKAEGAYAGTITNANGSAFPSTRFHMLVLENDDVWMFHGSGSLNVGGVVQGRGLSNNGSFRSSVTRDFIAGGAADIPLASTYVPDASIQGSLDTPVGTPTFSGTPMAAPTYDYDAVATLTAVAGDWSVADLAGVATELRISAAGAISSTGGCRVAGQIAPRASGKNVFNVQLTFGAAPCTLTGQTITGVAIVETPSGASRQLILGGVIADRTAGTVLSGTP